MTDFSASMSTHKSKCAIEKQPWRAVTSDTCDVPLLGAEDEDDDDFLIEPPVEMARGYLQKRQAVEGLRWQKEAPM